MASTRRGRGSTTTGQPDGSSAEKSTPPHAAPGAAPYVDPRVVGDGAPHHPENTVHRRFGEASAAAEGALRQGIPHIEPDPKRP
ncbi:hypothetical protein [Streptomyces sp. NPDC026673]|uniref:hypothetical protein n=1 Tax=Streptomyces sp. NPDC026673 TaxID=3155724 RepID=UPI00340B06EE